MFRKIAISMLGLVGIANLNAGPLQLQVGGAAGLTTSAVTEAITGGAAGSFGQFQYNGLAWPNGTVVGVSGNLCKGPTAPTPTSPCAAGNVVAVPTGAPNGEVAVNAAITNGEFATANGVTFAMINQGGSSVANVWGASNTAGTSSTPIVSTYSIPIGTFGVTNVWTMLNDEYGSLAYNSGQNTKVTFNFGSTATTANLPSLTFTLTNGVEIRDSMNCTGGSGLAACQALGYQTSLDTTNSYSTTGSANPAGPNVSAFNVYSGTYSGTNGAYANTTGTVNLDAQDFDFGSGYGSVYLNEYLVSITITDTNTATRQSRDGLTAVTIGVAPEPSTIFLLVAGLGVIAFVRFRQKSTS